jgi:uncharacterized protein YceH (UPF0502 family)
VELTAAEGRVLGCLVEKQLTTPQQYPLTENALLAACNQTTSREPVVSYDTATVRLAIRSLRDKGLLRTVHRSGERSDKHRHLLEEALALATGGQALLALLLLRGPQTVAELRARTERMHPFPTAADVDAEFEAMANRDEPLVVRLARQPGQKEARFSQLLVEETTPPALSTTPPTTVQQPLPATPQATPDVAALRDEVSALRREVAALRQEFDAARDAPNQASG